MPTLAFDVYGTLIDTHGVVARLEALLGDSGEARAFSQAWRDKQLEYSFRRGLMRRYATFAICTSDALDFVCTSRNANLSSADKTGLLEIYKSLPAYADVGAGLDAVRATGVRCFAFSNGTGEAVEGLLRAASIRDRFDGVVSVDEIKSFKPDPAVYKHFLQRTDTALGDAWLVSSNPFDVIGALSAGLQAVWVRRDPKAVFDPWGFEPTAVVEDLGQLIGCLA